MEWESARDILESWQRIKAEIERSNVWVENFPHHFPDALGKITASRLSGSPLEDALIVLQ
jgi:hypothetical protein